MTFPEVLDNVAHFDRILSATCSSIVLVGRAGIGRRTALSIVAALHGATLYTLKVGQHYGVKQFKNDLKTVTGFYKFLPIIIILHYSDEMLLSTGYSDFCSRREQSLPHRGGFPTN